MFSKSPVCPEGGSRGAESSYGVRPLERINVYFTVIRWRDFDFSWTKTSGFILPGQQIYRTNPIQLEKQFVVMTQIIYQGCFVHMMAPKKRSAGSMNVISKVPGFPGFGILCYVFCCLWLVDMMVSYFWRWHEPLSHPKTQDFMNIWRLVMCTSGIF